MVEPQSLGLGVSSTKSMNEMEEKKMINIHYKELCSLTNQLVTRAALTSETFKIAKDSLLKMIEEIDASLGPNRFCKRINYLEWYLVLKYMKWRLLYWMMMIMQLTKL